MVVDTGNGSVYATARTAASGDDEKRGRDTYLGLRFDVEISGVVVAGFSECSAPTMETEVFEYNEGGENTFTHKLPVRHKYSNITLKRGIDEGQDLYRWYQKAIDGGDKRLNVTISVYGPTPNEPALRHYILRRALPVKWTGPDLKSDAGAVAVETLELAHEGLEITGGRGR